MAGVRAVGRLLPSALKVPVMLAPMAGVSTPRLVAAASEAGILGFHGSAFRSAAQLVRHCPCPVCQV